MPDKRSIIMPKSDDNKFFPSKLRVMLDQVDGLGLTHGASWVSEGHAFAIHDPDVFMTDISPQFFDKQSRLRSFHRQLSIWGFSRLETGAAGRGVWYHKYFIRDKPEMIKLIKRVPVKNPKQTVPTSKDQLPDYTKYQLPSSSQTDNGHPTAVNSLPVLQSHHNAVAAAAIKGGLATSDFLSSHSMRPPPPPPDRLDYLSTLAGRLRPVLPPRYFAAHNAPLQVPDGGASSIVSDQSRMYQASLLQHQALLAAGNPNPPPGGYGIGEVTQQLKNNNPSSQNPMRHWDSNIDSAIVEYIRYSYRQGFPTPNINSVGFRQDVISAIMAQPDFYPQPPYGGGDGRPSTADF